MATNASAPAIEVGGDFGVLARSFRRGLLAANKSPRTIDTYLRMLASFARFLAARGMPTTVAAIAREHVEEYLGDQVGRFRPMAR
jgi:hypothetical protein